MTVHKFKLEVKDHHIIEGVPNDPCFCPVALALREALRDGCIPFIDKMDIVLFNEWVTVTPGEIELTTEYQHLVATTNDDIEAFIMAFDSGESVKPFTDIIEFMECVL